MVKRKKIFIFVQARLGSKRLKGKVLKKVLGKTLIQILLERLKSLKLKKQIFVLIPGNRKNNSLSKLISKLNYLVIRGSENDVLDRFYKAALKTGAKNIVRITGDCPLIDPEIVDRAIKLYKKKNVDYVSNVNPPSFPDGMDVEIFNFKSLKYAWQYAKNNYDREHVTPFIIRSKKLKCFNFTNNIDYSNMRLTLDKREDFLLIKNIIEYFNPVSRFNLKDILKFYKNNLRLFKVNSHLKRNYFSIK